MKLTHKQYIIPTDDVQFYIEDAIKKLGTLLEETYGPSGKNLILDSKKASNPELLKSGSKIIRNLRTSSSTQNLILLMLEDSFQKINSTTGDGTKTFFLITSYLILNGFKYIIQNSNAIETKIGISKTINYALGILQEKTIPIVHKDFWNRVIERYIPNDDDLQIIFKEAFEKIGKSGDLKIKTETGKSTDLIVEKGIQINRGFFSPYFITDTEKMVVNFENPGPFKLLRWVKDDRIELEANPDYWGGAPSIPKLTIRPVPSDAARANGLQSGELDIVPTLPPAMLNRLERQQDARIVRTTTNRVVYLGFDVATKPLGDLKLRQAIDCAIDRDALCTRLLRGLGKPEGQLAAPVTFGYDPAITPTAFDPAKARDLVKASTYAGEKILFQFPNNRTAFASEVAQAIAGYLGAVGIATDLQGMEYAAFFPLWLGRLLHGIHMFAFGPSIMDADLPLGSLYETGSRGYWTDPETDQLVKAQRTHADPAQRRALISQIWRRSQEFVPYAILYDEGSAYGIRNDVDWEPRADERLVFAKARFK